MQMKRPTHFNFRHNWTSRLWWFYYQVTRWPQLWTYIPSSLLPPGVPELILLALLLLHVYLWTNHCSQAQLMFWLVTMGNKSPPPNSKAQVRKVGPQGKLQCFYQKTGETDAGQTKNYRWPLLSLNLHYLTCIQKLHNRWVFPMHACMRKKSPIPDVCQT